MSSSVPVTTLELLRGFPPVSLLHTVTRNLSKPFSASYFDSLASSSSGYFAHHLVHLGLISVLRTSPCAFRQRHPKDSSPPLSTLLVNAEAPFNQLLLVLRTLIIAWKSRHTRVVLLGLASCRALPGLLGQLTKHSARRLGLVLDLAAL